MSVTKNFVGLTVLIFILTIAFWQLGVYYIFMGGNGLLLALLAVDMLASPAPRVLKARRDPEDKLYFKTENTVVFFVENTASVTLTVQAKDEIPDRHFTVTQRDLLTTVAPHSERAFVYTVIPGKRGCFLFEHIHLRFNGVLGLCVKYAKIPCPIEYKVYPNIKDLSKYRLMIQKNRLLPQGDKAVRIFGAGAEFESLRTYVEGDDYRKINWMATAREDRLMVNQFQSEKNQPVYIMLDTGRPMSYSVNGYKKLDYAINAALILSDIVNQKGDQSGLLVFDTAVQAQINPGKGAAHKHQLMEALYHVADSRRTSDYEGAFRALCDRQKRRALVFIFTDFEILEEAEELIAQMAWLKKRHFPMVVFMENESLNKLAGQATYGKKDRVLQSTAQEFIQERKQIFRTLNMMSIPNIESPAEKFALSAVNRYLVLRHNT